MSETIFSITMPKDENISSVTTFTAAGVTAWHRFTTGFALQINGTATSITYQLIRSSTFPGEVPPVNPDGAPQSGMAKPVLIAYGGTGSTANTVVDGGNLTGNPSTGILASYAEPGDAWWCVNVTALTGGNAVVALSGPQGG